MTEKELLYVEDVLSHSQDLEKICNNFLNENIEEDIKNFIMSIGSKHKIMFDTFYNIL